MAKNGAKKNKKEQNAPPVPELEGAGVAPAAPDDNEPWLTEVGDDNYGLSVDQIYAVEEALDAGDDATVRHVVSDLHEADIADLFEGLDREDRQKLVSLLGDDFDPEVLPFLDSSVFEEIVEVMEPQDLARSLTELASDDAIEVLEEFDEDQQSEILAALEPQDRLLLEESLTFPEDSAGRIMQREIVVVPETWNVGETIDYMRAAKDLPDDFYTLYVVDPKHHPIGGLPLSRVMRTRRPVPLTEIMDTDLKTIPVTMDQEEVAYLFRQYYLVSAPVVDDSGRLLGVITVDDVVDIIDEEAEEDLMKLGGVREADFYSDLKDTVKARSSWLFVNLLTAILASAVISFFEGTIEKLVALAVLLPIVASMGGNAGTQTLTVAVRAIAMKNLSEATAARFIGKEIAVGLLNGIVFAVIAGGLTWFWAGDPWLGGIIGAAMIVNMIVAGLAGTLIPLGLEKLNVDPAVASSVFLTTMTDVVGFFALLGLAALFLL